MISEAFYKFSCAAEFLAIFIALPVLDGPSLAKPYISVSNIALVGVESPRLHVVITHSTDKQNIENTGRDLNPCVACRPWCESAPCEVMEWFKVKFQ